MSTHSVQSERGCRSSLPSVVPFTLPHLSRLSWELGSHVVGDDDATCHGVWERRRASWTLSVFQVTTQTVVLCVQSPVGREHFYGAPRADFDSVLPELTAASQWDRVD